MWSFLGASLSHTHKTPTQTTTKQQQQRILPAQRLLEDAESAARVLAYVPDDELTSNLRRAWERAGWGAPGGDETGDLSVTRWDELSDEVEAKVRVCLGG